LQFQLRNRKKPNARYLTETTVNLNAYAVNSGCTGMVKSRILDAFKLRVKGNGTMLSFRLAFLISEIHAARLGFQMLSHGLIYLILFSLVAQVCIFGVCVYCSPLCQFNRSLTERRTTVRHLEIVLEPKN